MKREDMSEVFKLCSNCITRKWFDIRCQALELDCGDPKFPKDIGVYDNVVVVCFAYEPEEDL